jgi:hypothetical protein
MAFFIPTDQKIEITRLFWGRLSWLKIILATFLKTNFNFRSYSENDLQNLKITII